jgi:hypothetical protein
MTEGNAKIRRTLHFKFTLAAVDPQQLHAFVKTLAPFYEMFGAMNVRLLQNVDDPARYIQIVEYDAPAAMETNRQQIAADPRVQAWLQAWRQFVPNAVEVDVYRDVAR